MPIWKHKVSFKSFWQKEDLSIKEKGLLAAKTLRKLTRFSNDPELEEIIEMFECVSGDGEPTEISEFSIEDDFNARMDDLYDWADANRVWVETR